MHASSVVSVTHLQYYHPEKASCLPSGKYFFFFLHIMRTAVASSKGLESLPRACYPDTYYCTLSIQLHSFTRVASASNRGKGRIQGAEEYYNNTLFRSSGRDHKAVDCQLSPVITGNQPYLRLMSTSSDNIRVQSISQKLAGSYLDLHLAPASKIEPPLLHHGMVAGGKPTAPRHRENRAEIDKRCSSQNPPWPLVLQARSFRDKKLVAFSICRGLSAFM